jgi:hypothetical protein
VATSFIERAQNTAFDARTVCLPSNYVLTDPGLLTSPSALGADSSWEVTYEDFDDFDDFNGLTTDYTIGNEKYNVKFDVFYVDTANINVIKTNAPTFLKRMDIKVWRTYPAIDSLQTNGFDTLRMSTLFGYYKFNPI